MNNQQIVATSKKVSALLLMCGSLAITGCATNHGSKALSKTGAFPTTPNSLEIVSQESQKALAAQKLLVKYREQYSDTLDYRQRSFENDKVVVDYIGKPQNLLSSIAIRYGYRYLAYGAEGDLPTVNFTQYYATPESIIINVDAQLGESGSIAVDKQQKIITLIYPQ